MGCGSSRAIDDVDNRNRNQYKRSRRNQVQSERRYSYDYDDQRSHYGNTRNSYYGNHPSNSYGQPANYRPPVQDNRISSSAQKQANRGFYY